MSVSSPYRCELRVTDPQAGSEVEFRTYLGRMEIGSGDDEQGIPEMGSFDGAIECWTPLGHLPFGQFQILFEMAQTVEHAHVLEAEIRFFVDEQAGNIYCTFTTLCWMSRFSVSSGLPADLAVHSASASGQQDNNWLYMRFTPAITDEHQHHIRFTLGN